MDTSSCMSAALWLESMGCSVIPLRPKNKIPVRSWAEFQTRRATPDEIRSWFAENPDINIGLVCGEISGLIAVDVDGPNGKEWFKANMPRPNFYQQTSNADKFHAFYRHPGNGLRIPPSVKLVDDEIDVRGDGSYVVFAPSVHPSGAVYFARALEGFTDFSSLVPVPDIKITRNDDGSYTAGHIETGTTSRVDKGGRNDAITSLCGRLYAKGEKAEDVVSYALGWNRASCDPPLPENEVITIARSMSKTHAGRNPLALNADGVRHWVERTVGEFGVADIYRDLGIVNAKDRADVLSHLSGMLAAKKIEPCGKRDGFYRKVDCKLSKIDLTEVEKNPIAMWLPFRLHNHCNIYPKNIVVVAGETNSGKTGFFFNLCFQNHDKKFRYLTSEMTATEIRERIKSFGQPIEYWDNTDFIDRNKNFADAIDPDGINIIDFLEIYEDFSKIGAEIKKIFDALRNGVAFIAIQKKKGEEFGRGGEFTLEKARLGISLFTHGHLPNGIVGSAYITKCKNYIPGKNPDGKEIFYTLSNGYFYEQNDVKIVGHKKNFNYWSKVERDRFIKSIEAYCKNAADTQIADQIANFYDV